MRVMLIAGARPNFIKVAPILRELKRRGLDGALVHTGQHYDVAMSDVFFRELEIPPPDHHLGVGSGSHAVQTARVMEAFEPVLRAEAPDWVVVVGDVNSTLATALVTSKLKEDLGCRIAHVEAGLRSHDWRMPEEVNRVLTDRLSDVLLTPSRDARANLEAEGIAGSRIRFVGNVMIDTLLHRLPAARERTVISDIGVERKKYAVATLHRPSNVDDRASLTAVLEALGAVASEIPLVLPLHPRTAACVAGYGLTSFLEPLVVVESLGYLDMLALMDGAVGVLTDSGGIQEETTALGVPCVTLREQTERPITITEGTNRLSPWPPSPRGVLGVFQMATANGVSSSRRCPEGWDGKASERIVDAILDLD